MNKNKSTINICLKIILVKYFDPIETFKINRYIYDNRLAPKEIIYNYPS
jgi:hypothetical protein